MIKKQIVAFLDNFMQKLQNMRSWDDVPYALRKYVYKFSLFSLAFFLITIGITFYIKSFFVIGGGFLISFLLLIYSYYIRFKFRTSELLSFTGVCVKIENRWLLRQCDIYIKSENNVIYKFMIPSVNKKMFLLNDTITVYPIDRNSIWQQNQLNVITQYYVTDKLI